MSARAFYGGVPASLTGNQLVLGEEAFSREALTSSAVSQASGQIRLTYFTARKTEVSTQCRFPSGATAAGATPTLCRIGLFEIAANGDGVLVASTANDTTLFAAANTSYTKPWSASFSKVAGRRYALGALVVSGATMPTFIGQFIANSATNTDEAAMTPRISGYLAGLSDLPASFAAGSVFATNNRPYGVILP